jgi:hypothetical protein
MSGAHVDLCMFLHKSVSIICKYLPDQIIFQTKDAIPEVTVSATDSNSKHMMLHLTLDNCVAHETIHPSLLSYKSVYSISITTCIYQKRVLNRMHGPKREQANEGWRKLHHGELHNLHFYQTLAG